MILFCLHGHDAVSLCSLYLVFALLFVGVICCMCFPSSELMIGTFLRFTSYILLTPVFREKKATICINHISLL